ncbi:MAG: flagellar motor switch protein FliN [Deltaproteobacteria bacterium]|nr:flagellar motor switch protein FliN [Deltaproteobacteria bacterium]MBW2012810.1 flagellar motor switch protein FliN [Deltaproteobacteria bacterium]MBW2088209.1 flagellar motor switch protein FliN [Deltaproteobacteria bacterium]MBW2320881.1 flagellar motor switch protein FliN [Deltaproteobacteria bacterium]
MDEAKDKIEENNEPGASQDNGSDQSEKYDMDLILDLPLDVSVELGKVKMPVNELLQIGRGSILELTKPVGEPLDIYINNKLIAKGEVVILDDKFGVRVADIINPVDRVKSLG